MDTRRVVTRVAFQFERERKTVEGGGATQLTFQKRRRKKTTWGQKTTDSLPSLSSPLIFCVVDSVTQTLSRACLGRTPFYLFISLKHDGDKADM